jgi:large subunit GTPase 1
VRVGVSSTPGKTKHFQTLIVNEKLMLCDCPGLVFPSFMSSRGEMLCSGILPINNMRDYIEPAQVIASRVPIHLLNAAYGMTIKRDIDVSDSPDRPPTPFEMLSAYCAVKGYITNGTGRWDEFRACKDMLKDFTDGNILYVAPPHDDISMERWLQDTEAIMIKREKVAKRVAVNKLKKLEEEAEEEESMVFGGKEFAEDGGSIEGSDNEGEEEEGLVTREHKRLRQWGKKNKKLRNKTPYDQDNPGSYVAYSTNRKLEIGVSLSDNKVKRRDVNRQYGSVFVGVKTMVPAKI